MITESGLNNHPRIHPKLFLVTLGNDGTTGLFFSDQDLEHLEESFVKKTGDGDR